ncbi:EamA family transporter [Candidatus Micrarchaeota archaeon]|nr:EamA family transporter [Candidatus Micrarchaeota archaeon]
MAQWFWYALAAMVLLGASNLFFKLWAKENAFDFKALLPFVAIIALGFLAAFAYAFIVLKPSMNWLYYVAAVVLLSALAVAFISLALQKGKVAVVTAVLSLSTVLVAMLSFVFLQDKFSAKELFALALALLALLLLAV